jgi:uroporphyrinogen-III synthase
MIATTNPFQLEREIHAHFASNRKYGGKKDFFDVSDDELLEYFHTLTIKTMLIPRKRTRGEELEILLERKSKRIRKLQAEVDKLKA